MDILKWDEVGIGGPWIKSGPTLLGDSGLNCCRGRRYGFLGTGGSWEVVYKQHSAGSGRFISKGLACLHDARQQVFKSNNYGANWTEIFQFTFLNGSSVSKLNTGWKSIATDSTGRIIYGVNNGLWKSNDTHKFRQLVASEILYSVTTNGNGSKVLVGSKNSTWESFNGGNSFLKISVAGYSYAMSCDGAPMYAASRDGPMWNQTVLLGEYLKVVKDGVV